MRSILNLQIPGVHIKSTDKLVTWGGGERVKRGGRGLRGGSYESRLLVGPHLSAWHCREMFRNPSHSSISIYLPDTLTCSTHSRARLPRGRGRGGRYWGGEQPLLIDTTSLFACTSLDSTSRLSFFRLISQKAGSACLKECFFRGPGEGSFDCLEQWQEGCPCCGCCCKFNEHNGKVFDETIREIRESKASFNKVAAAVAARRWSYRLLSYSARQLQLLKTRARQSASTQGKRCRRAVEAPEPAGRHINRQLSNGQERNLCLVAGQDGVLLLLDRKCVAVLQRCNLVGPGSAWPYRCHIMLKLELALAAVHLPSPRCIRDWGVKTCAGVAARDLVEFTNLMKPFKSRKLLRHLECSSSSKEKGKGMVGGTVAPIEPQQLVSQVACKQQSQRAQQSQQDGNS